MTHHHKRHSTQVPSTCRFCSDVIWSGCGVKYGVRHYAHFACYLDAGKKLDNLRRWQIERFPWKLLRDRGLLAPLNKPQSRRRP